MDSDDIGVELYAEEDPAIWKSNLQAVADGEAAGDLSLHCPLSLVLGVDLTEVYGSKRLLTISTGHWTR